MKRHFSIFVAALLPALLQAQLFDFENAVSCAGYSSCAFSSSLGWTPYISNTTQGLIKMTSRVNTLDPGNDNCNLVGQFPTTSNPDSWELSELGSSNPSNTRYLAFQFTCNGNAPRMGITRNIDWSGEERLLTFHIAARLLSGGNNPTLMRARVGTFDASGAVCTMLPGVTWTYAEPVEDYGVVSISSTTVKWRTRSIIIPAGTTRIWIDLEFPAIGSNGTTYRAYIDDISVEPVPSGLPQEPNTNAAVETRSLRTDAPIIAPNPTSGNFDLYTTDVPANTPVQVIAADGRIVRTLSTTDDRRLTIDLSAEPVGLYSVRILEEGREQTVRVVRE